MADDDSILHVRKFPESVKEWADQRNINMSEETRRMWQERVRTYDAGEAAIRSRLIEYRAALEAVEERAEELREKIEEAEAQIETLYGETDSDALDQWVQDRPMLVRTADNPAVQDAAVRFNVRPEDVVERLEAVHGPESEALKPDLKSLEESDD